MLILPCRDRPDPQGQPEPQAPQVLLELPAQLGQLVLLQRCRGQLVQLDQQGQREQREQRELLVRLVRQDQQGQREPLVQLVPQERRVLIQPCRDLPDQLDQLALLRLYPVQRDRPDQLVLLRLCPVLRDRPDQLVLPELQVLLVQLEPRARLVRLVRLERQELIQ